MHCPFMQSSGHEVGRVRVGVGGAVVVGGITDVVGGRDSDSDGLFCERETVTVHVCVWLFEAETDTEAVTEFDSVVVFVSGGVADADAVVDSVNVCESVALVETDVDAESDSDMVAVSVPLAEIDAESDSDSVWVVVSVVDSVWVAGGDTVADGVLPVTDSEAERDSVTVRDNDAEAEVLADSERVCVIVSEGVG